LRVKSVIEKPEKLATNLAIMAIYVFHLVMFKALEAAKLGRFSD
jgi:dTDP-glucose pyrophosphorylase